MIEYDRNRAHDAPRQQLSYSSKKMLGDTAAESKIACKIDQEGFEVHGRAGRWVPVSSEAADDLQAVQCNELIF